MTLKVAVSPSGVPFHEPPTPRPPLRHISPSFFFPHCKHAFPFIPPLVTRIRPHPLPDLLLPIYILFCVPLSPALRLRIPY